jgi:protein DGCR14
VVDCASGLPDDNSGLCSDCSWQGLQTVIQRDFFPDVEKLQAQKEYLEAEENGDLERMRQIAIKFGSALGKISREPPPPCKRTGAALEGLGKVCYHVRLTLISDLLLSDVTPATFETPEVHPGSAVLGNKPRPQGRDLDDGE